MTSYASTEAGFDEEYLIRVFVKLRNNSNTQSNIPLASKIYTTIAHKTQYKLPMIVQRSELEKRMQLQHILTELSISDNYLVSSLREAGEVMHVSLKVVQVPITIIYKDTRTGSPISYEEYEGRYQNYLRWVKLKTTPTGLTPIAPRFCQIRHYSQTSDHESIRSKRPRYLSAH
jgi:hypothetical protein